MTARRRTNLMRFAYRHFLVMPPRPDNRSDALSVPAPSPSGCRAVTPTALAAEGNAAAHPPRACAGGVGGHLLHRASVVAFAAVHDGLRLATHVVGCGGTGVDGEGAGQPVPLGSRQDIGERAHLMRVPAHHQQVEALGLVQAVEHRCHPPVVPLGELVGLVVNIVLLLAVREVGLA
jgi:hypothetical protein